MKRALKALWLPAWVLCLAAVWAQSAPPPPQPVAVARDGFVPAQVDAILQAYTPLKLAAGGDQTLYSYLNMAQFFPHQLVARDGTIRALPSRPRPELGAISVETELGALSLDRLLGDPRSRVQGMIVLHRGAVVFEAYPGMRPQDSHLWWSVAKVLAGVVTVQLIEEGRLDADRDVVSYLPEFDGSGWAGVRVRDVLDMASGIDALDTAAGYADPASGIGRLIYAEGILKRADGKPAMGHDAALKSMRRLSAPGTRYQYSSANTNLLALLIERVTGQRYADVLQVRIWSRIGAEGDAVLGLSPDGRPIAHGMFSSRLRDLARLGLLFTPAGGGVLSPAVLARMTDTADNAPYLNAPDAIERDMQKLGARPVNALAQWDALFADGDLFKSGYDGQALYVSPARDVVIAMFSTAKSDAAYRYLRPIAQRFAARGRADGTRPPPGRGSD